MQCTAFKGRKMQIGLTSSLIIDLSASFATTNFSDFRSSQDVTLKERDFKLRLSAIAATSGSTFILHSIKCSSLKYLHLKIKRKYTMYVTFASKCYGGQCMYSQYNRYKEKTHSSMGQWTSMTSCGKDLPGTPKVVLKSRENLTDKWRACEPP